MERLLEFKNIIINYENASAELFLDGKYILLVNESRTRKEEML
jgi:hypothetical protein